jgi:hypothetical protein
MGTGMGVGNGMHNFNFALFACAAVNVPLDVCRRWRPVIVGLIVALVLPSCQGAAGTGQADAQDQLGGYNELSNLHDRSVFTSSEFNMDLQDVDNIDRPARSTITNFNFSTENFFGIWVNDPGPDVPHATFLIDEEYFRVVDFDGDGDMPYEVAGDSLVVYYNDFILRGRISAASDGETLIIQWEGDDEPTTYYKWVH